MSGPEALTGQGAWRARGGGSSQNAGHPSKMLYSLQSLACPACGTLTGHEGRGQGGRRGQGSDSRNVPPATGKNPTDEYLEGMMSEAPGPINFTMFLTMFGEKLNGTDPEDVIRNAFACFDEEASGQQPPTGGLDRAGTERFTQGAPEDANGAGLRWDFRAPVPKGQNRNPPSAGVSVAGTGKTKLCPCSLPPDARPQQPTSTKASHVLSSPVGPAHCPHFRPSQKPNRSRPFWPIRCKNQPPYSDLTKDFCPTANVSQGQARVTLPVISVVSRGPQAQFRTFS